MPTGTHNPTGRGDRLWRDGERFGRDHHPIALVNHSWGGELVLDITDLSTGDQYDVAYTDRDGRTLVAGSFRSVPDVLMQCWFNAAMLRADTARIDIASTSGEVVAAAVLA